MKYEVKLRPFSVPNFVIADWPSKDVDVRRDVNPPSLSLKDVSAESLEELCIQFRKDGGRHERAVYLGS